MLNLRFLEAPGPLPSVVHRNRSDYAATVPAAGAGPDWRVRGLESCVLPVESRVTASE